MRAAECKSGLVVAVGDAEWVVGFVGGFAAAVAVRVDVLRICHRRL
jgi:hypothetical protein